MIGLTELDYKLLKVGLNGMSLDEKNRLISQIANKERVAFFEITESYILDYHKTLKKDLMSEDCETKIIEGFIASNGRRYRTNRDDQVNMIGQKDELSEDDTITQVMWKTEDAGYISHTKEEWLKIYIEAFSHKKTQLFKYNTLKQQVALATSHEEIVDIKWDVEEVV